MEQMSRSSERGAACSCNQGAKTPLEIIIRIIRLRASCSLGEVARSHARAVYKRRSAERRRQCEGWGFVAYARVLSRSLRLK